MNNNAVQLAFEILWCVIAGCAFMAFVYKAEKYKKLYENEKRKAKLSEKRKYKEYIAFRTRLEMEREQKKALPAAEKKTPIRKCVGDFAEMGVVWE